MNNVRSGGLIRNEIEETQGGQKKQGLENILRKPGLVWASNPRSPIWAVTAQDGGGGRVGIWVLSYFPTVRLPQQYTRQPPVTASVTAPDHVFHTSSPLIAKQDNTLHLIIIFYGNFINVWRCFVVILAFGGCCSKLHRQQLVEDGYEQHEGGGAGFKLGLVDCRFISVDLTFDCLGSAQRRMHLASVLRPCNVPGQLLCVLPLCCHLFLEQRRWLAASFLRSLRQASHPSASLFETPE